jgi:hypothetical protein
MPEVSELDDDWEDIPDDDPEAMPAGPSGPAQPGVITELQDAARHVQGADRFGTVQVGTERQAHGARRRVDGDDDGVPGDAEPEPKP